MDKSNDTPRYAGPLALAATLSQFSLSDASTPFTRDGPRALVHAPDVLLMDEPFGALDALTREQVRLDLEALWLRDRMSVMFITHSVDEAVLLADKVVVMTERPGRVDRLLRVDLPRPRGLAARKAPEFIRLVDEITQEFLAHGVLDEGRTRALIGA